MTDIFLGLGKLFQFTFKILPPTGEVFNWILFIVGTAWFVYWCVKIFRYGSEEEQA